MTEEFKKYMVGFNFKKISISDFHKFYNQQGRKATKQQLTKWLDIYSQINKKKLIQSVSHNTRYYRFDILDCPISEESLLNMEVGQYTHIDDGFIKEAKSLIKNLKFRSNNKYKFSTESHTGKKLIFRLS